MSEQGATSPPRQGLHLTWPQLIGGSFALILAVAGATWAIRIDRLEQLKDRVDTYELSATWRLPDTLKQIRDATAQLETQLKAMDDVRRLRGDNARLQAELRKSLADNASTLAQLNNFRTRVIECDKQLAALSPEVVKITLTKRQSKSLAGYELVIGLVDVSSEVARLNINNEEKTARAGGHVPVLLYGEQCKLVLDAILYFETPERAELTLVCPKRRS